MDRAMVAKDHGSILLALARRAIATRLGIQIDAVNINADGWLQRQGASFVTLAMHGDLRGCIGSLSAYRPLWDDVQANAVAAAFHDSRFSPLSAHEYAAVQIEVSLLTALKPLDVHDEAGVLDAIRPGMDGVVFEWADGGGMYKSTFLPQVWEALPDPVQFMAHLKQKAGLPADFWHPDVRVLTYQVHKYRESRVDSHGQ